MTKYIIELYLKKDKIKNLGPTYRGYSSQFLYWLKMKVRRIPLILLDSFRQRLYFFD